MKFMKNMKLFPKTFLYTLILFMSIIVVIYGSIYMFLPMLYMENVRQDVEEKLETLTDVMEKIDSETCENVLESYAKRNGLNIITQIRGEKKVFQGSAFYIEMDEASQNMEIQMSKSQEAVLLRNQVVKTRDDEELHLQVMANVQPGKEAVALILRILPLTAGAAVLLSVLFSYWYSGRITKPVYEMLEVTEGMKQLKEDAHVQVHNEDEIGILGGQINQLYERLRQTIDGLEREKRYILEIEKSKVDFLRAASHELKTPLARLRILLENMQYDVGKYKDHTKYLGVGIDTIDDMSEMVKEILDSSKIQGEAAQAEKKRLCVKEELEELLKEYSVLAQSRGLKIKIELEDALYVEMNPQFFKRVWSNLIQNAIHYSEADGEILIQGTKEELSIWNPCTPLSKEQAARLFEAFYRPDFARDANSGGNGLGLYIVKEILDANQLGYTFEPFGGGMKFRIFRGMILQ